MEKRWHGEGRGPLGSRKASGASKAELSGNTIPGMGALGPNTGGDLEVTHVCLVMLSTVSFQNPDMSE